MTKTQLPCCAICFLSGIGNNTTVEELQGFIDNLKEEAFSKEWEPDDRESGERGVLTVCTPSELLLSQKLESVGFKLMSKDFNRRFGYPEGKLKLYSYEF